MPISQRIKQLREARGWSRTKLASLAGVSQGYLSDIENNKVRSPSGEVIAKIAGALGTSTDHLLGRMGPVGNEIKRAREKAGMTVDELADKASYPAEYVRRVEAGGDPSPAFLEAACEAMGYPVEALNSSTSKSPQIVEWIDSLPDDIRGALSNEDKRRLAQAGIELALRADKEGLSTQDLQALVDAMIHAARRGRRED